MPDPLSQPVLFEFQESVIGVAELFPKVWTALENLTSPNVEIRKAGLDQLLELDAPRISPLVVSVLATRIADRDINLRFSVVQSLGEILNTVGNQAPPEQVRAHLKVYLGQMRHREIYALLEVAEEFSESETNVATLLNGCSFAGNALTDIILDRRKPTSIRRQGINFSGRVGFLDVLPALEKLAGRLEAASNGQHSMPFASSTSPEEKTLLSAVQSAITILQAP